MILLGIGANLPSATFGPPRATCGAALESLEKSSIYISQRSRWYETAPIPVSDQPWYVNGVVAVTTSLPPDTLMTTLLKIETHLGRSRGHRNAPRVVDLDLLAYNDRIINEPPQAPLRLQIPHPRMHERLFVINPLLDISQNWVHPVLGRSAASLRDDLLGAQEIHNLPDADGLFGTEWRSEK